MPARTDCFPTPPVRLHFKPTRISTTVEGAVASVVRMHRLFWQCQRDLQYIPRTFHSTQSLHTQWLLEAGEAAFSMSSPKTNSREIEKMLKPHSIQSLIAGPKVLRLKCVASVPSFCLSSGTLFHCLPLKAYIIMQHHNPKIISYFLGMSQFIELYH